MSAAVLRKTAGINTTSMQEKHRGRGLDVKPKSPLAAAKSWLKLFLEEGPQSPSSVKKAAETEGIAMKWLTEAKKELGIEVSHTSGEGWTWALPQTEEAEQEVEPVQMLREATIEPGEDEFSLRPEEKRAFGIRDNEQHCWIRDDRYWGNKVPGNRQREFLRENAGARIILVDGEPVSNGTDLILAVRPKSEIEKKAARDKAIEDDYHNRIEREKLDDDEFDSKNREALEYRKHINTVQNIQAGLIGPNSPSTGLPYEDYIKFRGLTKAQIEAEEVSYSCRRTTSRETNEPPDDRRQQPRGSDGKFYSLPPNVRPRNLAARTA